MMKFCASKDCSQISTLYSLCSSDSSLYMYVGRGKFLIWFDSLMRQTLVQELVEEEEEERKVKRKVLPRKGRNQD